MSRALVLAAITLAAACADEVEPSGSSEVDFSRPKNVVRSIFYAARTGDAAHLASLCDPRGEVSASARRVCEVAPGQGDWASFARHFARGSVTGEPRITGDSALLNFSYGPDGTLPETMEMVRRDGGWYLSSF